MTLVCFDVDGTLSTSSGPVPWGWVVERYRDIAGPIRIAIVSPSAAWPQKSTVKACTAGPTRADNLRAARGWCPLADIRLYVSDNGDYDQAALAGFALITPVDFVRAIDIGG